MKCHKWITILRHPQHTHQCSRIGYVCTDWFESTYYAPSRRWVTRVGRYQIGWTVL